MSGDPKRLLAGGNAMERRLLRSLGNVDPPAGARDAVWAAMATPAPFGAAALIKSALELVSVKSAVIGVAASAVVVGAATLNESAPKPLPPVVLTSPQAIASVAPAVTESAPQPAIVVTVPPIVKVVPIASSAPAPIVPPEPPSPASALKEETDLLRSARAALRRGDARAALETLDTVHERFPNGMLDQESRVLRIETLVALGDRGRARDEADAFVRDLPDSPHVSRVRALVR